MPYFRSLIEEIHRRGLWQAAIAFLGTSWAVLQVVDLFTSRGLLPDWTFNGALVALGLGFPVIMATAYVQTPASSAAGGSDDPEAEPALDPEAPRRLADFLTWRRAFMGGAIAFALLGLGTAVYGVMRIAGIGTPGTLVAQGVLEEGGLVVLADFESSAGTAVSSDLVTEALRIDLEQSTAFELLDPREVGEALRRMVREPDAALNESVALELAIREGAGLVVSGDVGRLGSGYIVAARILAAEDGSVLAAFRETAADSTELIEALDELSAGVRSKMGESLRSVATAEPLMQVTTGSLDALRKFSYVRNREPRGAIGVVRAQEVVEEALALDSTFAQAHRYLSILITNYGGSAAKKLAASAAAFRHREHLPFRDRLAIEANYHVNVSGDHTAATRAFRGLLEADPTDMGAAINLADQLMYSGDYIEAAETLLAHEFPDQPVWVFNLAVSWAGQQRFTDALDLLNRHEDDNPGIAPFNVHTESLLLLVQGKGALARELDEAGPVPLEYPFLVWQQQRLAMAAAWEGKLEEAERHARSALEQLEDADAVSDGVFWGVASTLITGWMGMSSESAIEELDSVVERFDGQDGAQGDRRFGAVALGYAVLGATESVTAVLARLEADQALAGDADDRARGQMARALIQVQQGDPNGISAFERAAELLRCARCADFYRGVAYEADGQVDPAVEAYSRYIDSGFVDFPRHVLTIPGSVVHERLGILHEAKGDSASAATHYAEFVRHWGNADPDQQPRVERAKERILALGGRIPLA